MSLAITFALYYLTVGAMLWWIEWGLGILQDEFAGCSRPMLVWASLWVIVAWPEVLRFKAMGDGSK